MDAGLTGAGCTAVGALLHYSLLVMFCWMLVEGFHIYHTFVTVFESRDPHRMHKYCGLAYGTATGCIILDQFHAILSPIRWVRAMVMVMVMVMLMVMVMVMVGKVCGGSNHHLIITRPLGLDKVERRKAGKEERGYEGPVIFLKKPFYPPGHLDDIVSAGELHERDNPDNDLGQDGLALLSIAGEYLRGGSGWPGRVGRVGCVGG